MLSASLYKFVVSETWGSSPRMQSSECKDATWPLLHCPENKELAQVILLWKLLLLSLISCPLSLSQECHIYDQYL